MACEYQKDVKFDEVEVGDLILVELFEGDHYYGDRRGIAREMKDGVWFFNGMSPVYKGALGYRMFKVTVMDAEWDRKQLEKAITRAEYSDSSEAHLLVAEIRRLRKIEDGLKNLVGMRKQVVEALRTEADEWDSIGAWQSAGQNRDSADRIMAEVWPLEALLSE